MRWYHVLAVLALICCSLVVTAPTSPVKAANGDLLNTFITALNNGDMATAAAQLSPNFVLTLADGTTVNGSDALSQLTTPITLVSFSPIGNHQITTVLQFGSDAPVTVSFTGAGGMIATMTVIGPA